MATWRSGYAAACKAVYTGSIPVVASKKVFQNDCRRRQQRMEQASVRNAVCMSGSRS